MNRLPKASTQSSSKRATQASWMLRHLRVLGSDTSGAAAVIVALVFPIVIGGMGLGAETGYWYLTLRKLQHAVDVSVHAAAVRKRAGDTKVQIDAAALYVATESGYLPASGTLTINIPPQNGAFAGNADSVEVIVTETQARLFSSVFNNEPVTLGARAVAKVTPTGSVACVLALKPTAPGAVTVDGSTSIDLLNCDVASSSNAMNSFLMNGSAAKLSTGCVYAVGQAVTTTGLTLSKCANVKEYAPIVRDPYASVAEPAVVGTCRNKNVGNPNSATTLTPTENHPSGVTVMRFCSCLDAKGAVTFGPGHYIIEGGDFTVNSGDVGSFAVAELIGSGITFYFPVTGRLRVGGNAKLNLVHRLIRKVQECG